MSTKCNLCNWTNTKTILDLGLVPIAHRYRESAKLEDEYKHKLAINICENCAFIQMQDPISASELYREYNFCFSAWKSQPHMADEVNLLKKIVGADATLVEIGSNDGSFLKQLQANGFINLIGIEPNIASSKIARNASINVIEAFFDERSVSHLLSQFGKVDVVVARQVIEHVQNLSGLMNNINHVLKPNGWLLFEVPDFEVPLRYGDCSQLWEEHVNYFTEPVMKSFLKSFGYEAKFIKRYPFSGGALMVMAQRISSASGSLSYDEEIEQIKTLAYSYKEKVEKIYNKLILILENNREKKIANILYGTGCRANTFVNGLKLSNYFDVVVDDQAEKIGLFMPGSTHQIKSSESIYETIGDCFLSVNVENESKVMGRHKKYSELGGKFYSINSPSMIYLSAE